MNNQGYANYNNDEEIAISEDIKKEVENFSYYF